MPHPDSEVLEFRGSQVFAVLYFVSAYWQLPLHPGSYDACNYCRAKAGFGFDKSTPWPGKCNIIFTKHDRGFVPETASNMKAWLDDFNLHATNEEQLLLILERFFEICENYGLFLSAKKCIFFLPL